MTDQEFYKKVSNLIEYKPLKDRGKANLMYNAMPIKDYILKSAEITLDELLGQKRHGNLVYWRHMFWWLLQNKAGFSLWDMAKISNRKSHGTVQRGILKVNNQREVDRLYNVVFNDILTNITPLLYLPENKTEVY